jgi:hypothetical protein
MTIWNSTCNPCFSTFEQIFFVFRGLKTDFFCYSLKLNFICYLNRFFTFDYSLWDGGRHTFLQAKTNFNYVIIYPSFLFVYPQENFGPNWYFCLVFSVLQYQVKTFTGDIRSSGTDSDVYIIIHGDLGSTGRRLLKKSKTHNDKFERDQVRCLIYKVWLKVI